MRGPGRHRRRARGRRARGQRGIALVAVITAVAICLVIVNDFGTKTTIDVMQSRNNLDQMRAHFLARSSLNITELVVRLQDQLDKTASDSSSPAAQFVQGVQITEFADPLMAAFGGDDEQVEGAIGFSTDDVKGLGADIGTFGVRLTPIDGKINVNCAANAGPQRDLVAAALQSLIFPAAFDPLFESPDADGWRRDRRAQVAAIIDYIDTDSFKVDFTPTGQVETTSAAEDYGYETLRDPYKPKNRAIDSVAELKLVRGVDDRFWTLFGSAFRVHGGGTAGCRVNLRALDDVKVAAALIALAAKETDPVLRDPVRLWAFANLVLQAKQYGVYESTADLVDFLKDPRAKLEGLFADPSKPGTQAYGAAGGASTIPFEIPPGGVELETAKLDKVAQAGPVRVYDVEAWSEIVRPPFLPLRRTMRAVWDREVGILDPRTTSNPAVAPRNGAWLYLREE